MRCDTLIVGGGIGGASAALRLSEDRERDIVLLRHTAVADRAASFWAQGGITTLGLDDSPERFAADVARAGAGLGNPPAIEVLTREGPRLLREVLIDTVGVRFDEDPGGAPAFGLEAAHSTRRILHVGDATGRAIMTALWGELARRPNVRVLDRHTAVDLLTFPHHASDPLAVYQPPSCHGVYALDQSAGVVRTIAARHTVLATGGLGQIFLNTTNPPGARGDGLAMAWRAGARVVNAQFVQFHPTALHMAGTTKALISEAVRGEGAVLLTPDGDRFMPRYAPDAELATRDVVARAIFDEMLAGDHTHVLLDIASRRPAAEIRERFPAIHALCLEHNLDISRQPIPVVPAAHYFCGGVLVDLDGRTTLPGLWAVGEIACTGVHGANRLASTSLLEGLVWGDRAARDIRGEAGAPAAPRDVPDWDESGLSDEADPALIQGDLHTVRSLMWHYVGLRRNEKRLARATVELQRLWQNIEAFYRRASLTDALVGLRNAVLSALIVARAAQQATVSQGCHFREDSRAPEGAQPPNETNDATPG